MSNLTTDMNEMSISSVRESIAKKIGQNPYMANNKTVINTVTDMDHHPYNRWYRGVYYYPDPIIMEREAGWRPQRENCYNLNIPPEPTEDPNYCYQTPCSTIHPCFGEKNDLSEKINNMCIVQYR